MQISFPFNDVHNVMCVIIYCRVDVVLSPHCFNISSLPHFAGCCVKALCCTSC